MGFEFLCGLGIHRRRGKTIPPGNSSREEKKFQGITIGLVSTILCVVYFRCPCLGCSCRRGHVSIFINTHYTRVYLIKESERGLLMTGLKGWPFFTESRRTLLSHIDLLGKKEE